MMIETQTAKRNGILMVKTKLVFDSYGRLVGRLNAPVLVARPVVEH